jgi:hypothetical protein
MEIPGHWLGEEAVLSVFDLAGTSVWSVPMTLSTLETNLQLPSETWPSGLYHLGLTSIHGTKRQSIMLMR